MRRFISYGPSVVVLLAVVIALLAVPGLVRRVQLAQTSAVITLAQARLDTGSLLEQINQEVRAIGEATLPGVVHVRARSRGETVEYENGERFHRPADTSTGAGWLWDTAGHIVTNAHVVSDATDVAVELFDGRVRDAVIVGFDAQTDVAVLKIDPEPAVFPLRRATGQEVYVGDRVYAFGSPFEIKFSMSEGIVSGLGRGEAAMMMGMRSGYTNFIQTDAAINPGNSGGPLVNVNGRVVGMNTAIANASHQNGGVEGQSAGIGFAIPLRTVESVVEQLIDADVVLRGYLGVVLYTRFDIREQFERIGFEGSGVLIDDIREGQPAERFGVRPNDIILAIDGRETPSNIVLISEISSRTPGTEVALRVWRDGQPITVKAKLGAALLMQGPRGDIELDYIPGSENMTLDEIRRKLGGS